MATTAGALSQLSVGSNSAKLQSAEATGGTGPYTYQWYRSTTTGFSPGGGNIITGATSLILSDSGLIPNTAYFYKVVATDSLAVAGTSSQLAVTTAATQLSQNQFAQSQVVGSLDEHYNYDTVPAQIDSSQVATLYQGMAVKVVDSAGGVPKVIACSANADDVFGFINYDVKTVGFVAGSAVELSQEGNVMFLYATAAIARGARVQLDLSASAAVAPLTGSSGADIVGFAMDKASAAGDLIRVRLLNPSFAKA